MRHQSPEALKKLSLPNPDNANVFIPSRNLLGYRGPETVLGVYVPRLPKTFDGTSIKSLAELEMRPLIEQFSASKTRVEFPVSQVTTPPAYEMRCLAEILEDQMKQLEPTVFPSVAKERDTTLQTKRKAS